MPRFLRWNVLARGRVYVCIDWIEITSLRSKSLKLNTASDVCVRNTQIVVVGLTWSIDITWRSYKRMVLLHVITRFDHSRKNVKKINDELLKFMWFFFFRINHNQVTLVKKFFWLEYTILLVYLTVLLDNTKN